MRIWARRERIGCSFHRPCSERCGAEDGGRRRRQEEATRGGVGGGGMGADRWRGGQRKEGKKDGWRQRGGADRSPLSVEEQGNSRSDREKTNE